MSSLVGLHEGNYLGRRFRPDTASFAEGLHEPPVLYGSTSERAFGDVVAFEKALDRGEKIGRVHPAVAMRDAYRTSSINNACVPILRDAYRKPKSSVMGTPEIDIAHIKQVLIDATQPGGEWTRRKLSLATGLGADLVRNIIGGRSGNPKMDTLARLATAMGKDVSIFVGNPVPHDLRVSDFVEVIGSVEAGVWREQVEWTAADRYHIAVGPAPMKGIERFALKVEGYSMDRLFPPGTLLDCLRAGPNGIKPLDGDLVIAERCMHDLREATCKRLRQTNDGVYELIAESTYAEFAEPIPLGAPDVDLHVDDNIQIIGVVVGSYQAHFRAR